MGTKASRTPGDELERAIHDLGTVATLVQTYAEEVPEFVEWLISHPEPESFRNYLPPPDEQMAEEDKSVVEQRRRPLLNPSHEAWPWTQRFEAYHKLVTVAREAVLRAEGSVSDAASVIDGENATPLGGASVELGADLRELLDSIPSQRWRGKGPTGFPDEAAGLCDAVARLERWIRRLAALKVTYSGGNPPGQVLPSGKHGSQKTRPTLSAEEDRGEWQERALAIVFGRGRDWSVTRIAGEVGVSRSSLYRDARVNAALKGRRAPGGAVAEGEPEGERRWLRE